MGTLVGFIGITFFARELGPSQLGTFFLFQALLGILSIPANFGINDATRKRLSEDKTGDDILSSALLVKTAPLLFVIVGVVLFHRWVNRYLGMELALLLALTLLVQELARFMLDVLHGELRVDETPLIQFSRQTIWVLLGAVMVVYGYGANGLIFALAISLFITFLWAFWKQDTSYGKPSRESIRSLLDYSKYSAVTSVGGYLYNWADVAIIGFFLTHTEVGAYEVAWRVSGPVLLLSTAISTTIFPQISRWDSEGAKDRIEKLIRDVLTPSLFLIVPSFVGVLLLSRQILGIVFGGEFEIAWLVLIILMADKIFQGGQVIIGRSLKAIDYPELAAKAAVISIVINIGLNVLLIWKFGIVGAAIATLVASILNDLLHYRYLSRFLNFTIPVYDLGWLFLASSLMGVVLSVILSMIQIDTLPELFGVVILGAILYIPTALMYRPVRDKVFAITDEYVHI